VTRLDDHTAAYQSFHRIPTANIQAIFMRLQRITIAWAMFVISRARRGDYFYAWLPGRAS